MALLKEWRLILRDPYLISQTLLQLLYLVPLALLLFLGDRQELAGMPLLSLGLGAGAVFLGATLVSSLARICISGEEAPDLLAAAPLPRGRLRTYKLVAALLPIWLLCLPIFALLGVQSAAGWPLLLLCFVGATVSVGVLNIWNAKTVPRGELFKREAQAGRDSVLAIIEGVLIWAWLGASLGLYSGAWWGWLALGVGLLGPVFAYARYRGRGSMLTY